MPRGYATFSSQVHSNQPPCDGLCLFFFVPTVWHSLSSELCPGIPVLVLRFGACRRFSAIIHKLNRSMLSLSPLRTLLTMPSLKYFSSPAAVLPPMYILSAPSTSRNPSVELSLPRRLGCWGMGIPRGDVTPRAAADCDWAAAAACAAIPRDVEGAVVDTE